ncbi:MAG: MotA/TolQ/ExbB proton channel family protein [Plesiomonas sp.]|uniref:MotA/TolQ/ExbB proton channel family protein n=1 Tax=Plesiomonas sp. TaxID=2486279 RepID=UPI003F3F6F82
MLLTQLEQQLGMMMWPLLICSFLTGVIVLDRLFKLLQASRFNVQTSGALPPLTRCTQQGEFEQMQEALSGQRSLLLQGLSLLIMHRAENKLLREEIAAIWLQNKRRQLSFGLKMLTLIAAISPLLGLLGTILGLIQMFQDIGISNSPVTPALLANGLGIAMYTTAAGLLIALPAIIGAQLFSLWIDRLIHSAEHGMNQYNLWLEGIALNQEFHQ